MTPTKQDHLRALLLLLIYSYSIGAAAKHNTTVPCLPDQASSLLQLKRSFVLADPAGLSSWRAGSDCCRWPLVICDMASGRVISLDLSAIKLKSLDPALFNLTSLENLSLNTGGISKELSSLSKLQMLNELHLINRFYSEKATLSGIGNLQRLVTLELEGYDFSRSGSSWIGNLSSLASLEFIGCSFPGPIPYQIGNLANLEQLDVEGCGSTKQPFPLWIRNLTKLGSLGIQGCNFFGPIPSTIWNFTELEVIQMGYNNLTGKIPKSLFYLPELAVLILNDNQLSGSLEDIPNPLSSPLFLIGLDSNQLTGPIPKSFYQLKHLETLTLDSNSLSGTLELSSFWRLESLTGLSLSDNKLSVVVDEGDNNTSLSLPKIQYLFLAYCNLTKLPGALRYLDKVSQLDLSNNKIDGVIPSWIWENWKDQLYTLDLSNNRFTSLERAPSLFNMPNLYALDLSFNRLQGSIPIPVSSTPWASLDYSNNNFSLVPDFGKFAKNVTYLNLSKNRLNGVVPSSICSVSELTIVDLSYNNFTGMIPTCLIENEKLTVLKLKENKLQWIMPINIKVGFKFQTIDLNGNRIEGELPISLMNCKDLELLDVGNNQIVGSFPSWLGTLPKLRVLVLRLNQLNGTIMNNKDDRHISNHFPSLQILDLASNNFSGSLSEGWFNELKAMMGNGNDEGQVIGYESNSSRVFYQDTVTLTFKGGELSFTKILTALKTIDLSNNSFDGPVPESIGRLVSLHGLNMSYNNFTGQMPYQFGKLSQLESLDLSWNQLSGEIPQGLTSLTSLEWLNLSYNRLYGRIPQGNQFLTFSGSSFEGNMGLCGPPLSRECDTPDSIAPNAVSSPDSSGLWEDKLGVILLFALVGLGFGVGFALSFLLRVVCRTEGWGFKH